MERTLLILKREVRTLKYLLLESAPKCAPKMCTSYPHPAHAARTQLSMLSQRAQQGLDGNTANPSPAQLAVNVFILPEITQEEASSPVKCTDLCQSGWEGKQINWAISSLAGTASERCNHHFNKSVVTNLCFNIFSNNYTCK